MTRTARAIRFRLRVPLVLAPPRDLPVGDTLERALRVSVEGWAIRSGTA
jgi:hypothetical protein